MPAVDNPHRAELDRVLVTAAQDADEQIRSAAVFALGVLGDEAAIEQLKKSLIDVYPDVRYNAATGLARHGNAAGLAVILEMLDPDEQASVRLETEEQSRDFKRSLITVNALQVAPTIYSALSAEDQQRLREAIERLSKQEQPAELRLRATEILRQLEQNVAEAPGK